VAGDPKWRNINPMDRLGSALEENVDLCVDCRSDMAHGMPGKRRTPKQNVKALGGEDAQGQGLPLAQNLRQEGKP
jgi:hypothetical protein